MLQTISHYKVVLPAGRQQSFNRATAFVHGWNEDNLHRLTCHFHPDGNMIPENDMSNGIVHLHYPMSDFSIVIDLFRNESPIMNVYDPETREGQIMTEYEPIGQGEINRLDKAAFEEL